MSFDKFAEHIRKEEGGYSNNPVDPGGATNMGITQRELDRSRAAYPDLRLPLNVKDLTWPQAKEIYRRNYWNEVRGDDLPVGIGLLVADAAVNQGTVRAKRWLQEAAGVKVDGWIGPGTLSAVRKANQLELMGEVAARRAHHYMLQDSIDDTFGLGWARRLFRIYNAALEAA